MTNEELKEKILTIVRGAMAEADELPFIETTDNIADALIKFLEGAERSTEEDRQVWISKWEEAEHRAEIAEAENAELRARLDKAVELPCKVMIERTLVDGKFKPTQKAQAFNGRIGVVYRDEKRWKGLLVDICSEKVYDYDAANARLAELKGEKK